MLPDQIRQEVIADLGRFTHDPLGFVLWAFPWGGEGTSLAKEDGPDEWQRAQLNAIGEHLKANPHTHRSRMPRPAGTASARRLR